jgi:hypothetical protein
MVATTYNGAGIAVPADTTGTKSKGFWTRAYNAIAESQMQRAERELARYAYLLPRDFALTQLRREDEPFGGW